MHEYDVTLKRILTRPGSALLVALTGSPSLRWLNVELPKVNNRRLDLLGERPDRELFGIEFQSRNEKHFPFRMGAYLFGAAEQYGRLPRQIVLYVGEARLRMKNRIETPDLSYRFHLVDIRDLDGEALLASPNLGDNVLAILTRLGDQRDTVRRILERIARGPVGERGEALAELSIVAGLRKPARAVIVREAKNMPIHYDIMDNELIGPVIRKEQAKASREGRLAGLLAGRAEGLLKGHKEGHKEGRVEGQRDILLDLMQKRFGRVPQRIRRRLAALQPDEIREATLRVLDAQRIDDLFA
jgi:hypothetical protein